MADSVTPKPEHGSRRSALHPGRTPQRGPDAWSTEPTCPTRRLVTRSHSDFGRVWSSSC